MDDPVAVSANVTIGGLAFQLSLNCYAFVDELNITRKRYMILGQIGVVHVTMLYVTPY